MVSLADIVQVADRLHAVVDHAVPSLQAGLPRLEHSAREAIQRTIADTVTTAGRSAPTATALGSDVGLDLVVAKVDPTATFDREAFTADGVNGHPWIKEDLSHLTHATTETERHARDQGRGAHQPFINPVPQRGIVPWATPEPPKMREGAQMQRRARS